MAQHADAFTGIRVPLPVKKAWLQQAKEERLAHEAPLAAITTHALRSLLVAGLQVRIDRIEIRNVQRGVALPGMSLFVVGHLHFAIVEFRACAACRAQQTAQTHPDQ